MAPALAGHDRRLPRRRHRDPRRGGPAPLAYAPKLQRITSPYGTPVADLSPLAHLRELVYLEMAGSKIRDLAPLRGLTKLEFVDVRTSRVTDISPLMDLPNLRELDIRNLRLPPGQIDAFKAKHPGARVSS